MKERVLALATNFLVVCLVIGVALLSYSVFADSYATDRTLPPTPAVPVQEITPVIAPRLDIVSGLANDQSLIFGPWPIVSEIANLLITNETKETFVLSFNLRFDLAMCLTSRDISITIGNRTRMYSLKPDFGVIEQSVQLEVKPSKFYNITVQVSGPVCQVDSDPRLFYGSLSFNNYEYHLAKEFVFGEQT